MKPTPASVQWTVASTFVVGVLTFATWPAGAASDATRSRSQAPASNASAVGGSRFTLEHALTLATFSDLTWSPDARRLAFVVTEVDTAENATNQDLWLIERGTDRPIRLTRHAKADISPTFSPGGDTIAFVGYRATGEDAKSAIYMMSLRGGEPWTFGAYDESVSEVKWSPDGRWLAFVKLDTLAKPARDWRKKKWDHVVEDQRLQYPQLWVADVATGKTRRLTSGAQYVWYVRWSPDSRSIAFLVSPTGKPDDENLVDIGIVPVAGGAMRRAGVIGGPFAWSPDGRWIATATGADRASYVQKSDLWLIPGADGRAIDLTASFDEDADTPAWNPSSDTLWFHTAQGVTTRLAAVVVPRALARDPKAPIPSVTLLTDREAEAGAPVTARDGRFAWVQATARRPYEVWIADHPRLAGRAASGFHLDVSRLDLGETREVTWKSSDGVTVGGILIRPPGAAARGPLKTLVQLHGGPYGSRNALGFQALPHYFAAHGYQVFLPNFRSSAGYGVAFQVRERADWGGQDWRDVTSGIDSLIRWGLADRARLGVYGRSYGGYLTAWAITQTDRFDAACVFAGAVDLGAFYGQSDIQKYRAWEFEGRPWETPEKWAHSSPIRYIENVRTPTLIQVGDNDARVPFPQGQQLYRALLDRRVPVEFVHYPREGHVLREPRHRADQMARMLAWWDKWVK
jgi:dipeptidyl aminopeptidase/acylaminoacyl peptidase